jgi:hypothetical protein
MSLISAVGQNSFIWLSGIAVRLVASLFTRLAGGDSGVAVWRLPASEPARRKSPADARAFRYRYEYDLGPEGLDLVSTLVKSEKDTEWSDARRDESCWQNAARTEDQKTEP